MPTGNAISAETSEPAELNAIAQFEANLVIAKERLGVEVWEALECATDEHDIRSISIKP